MKEQIRQIARLIEAVQIEDVRLVDASARTRIRSPKDLGDADLVIETSARVKKREKNGTFLVLAVVNAQVFQSASRENPAVSIRAGFELKYRLPAEFRASQRDLNKFAQVNGVFNAWPYWREFIQSTTARMDLPPLILPVLRLVDTTKAIPKRTSEAKTR